MELNDLKNLHQSLISILSNEAVRSHARVHFIAKEATTQSLVIFHINSLVLYASPARKTYFRYK